MFDWVVNTPLLIKKSNRLHFKLIGLLRYVTEAAIGGVL